MSIAGSDPASMMLYAQFENAADVAMMCWQLSPATVMTTTAFDTIGFMTAPFRFISLLRCALTLLGVEINVLNVTYESTTPSVSEARSPSYQCFPGEVYTVPTSARCKYHSKRDCGPLKRQTTGRVVAFAPCKFCFPSSDDHHSDPE